MFALGQSRETDTLPQYKPLAEASQRSRSSSQQSLHISRRFWTVARVCILASSFVIFAFVWSCAPHLRLEHLQTQDVAWLSAVTSALDVNVTIPLTRPPAGYSPEGVVETTSTTPSDDPVLSDDKALDDSNLELFDGQFDVVYTWVNGSDPEHLALKQRLGSFAKETRYDYNMNELRYSLRSLDHHIPWFKGNIYIVTPGQTPDWLNTSNPRVKIINQDDILPKEALPTCNAFLLEFYLDRIPGLSEKFVYMNDDYFLLGDVTPFDFFTRDGRVKSFPNSPARQATIGDFLSHDLRLNRTQGILGTDRDHDNIWQTSMSYTILQVREVLDVHTVSFYHLPFVWERSVMEQVRVDFNESLTAMYPHKFRHWRDLQAPSVIFSEYLALSGDRLNETDNNYPGVNNDDNDKHLLFEPIDPSTTKGFALFGGCGDEPKDARNFERTAGFGHYKFGNMNADWEKNPKAAGFCRKVLSRMFPGTSQYELVEVSEGIELSDEEEEEELNSDVRVGRPSFSGGSPYGTSTAKLPGFKGVGPVKADGSPRIAFTMPGAAARVGDVYTKPSDMDLEKARAAAKQVLDIFKPGG